ncbi:hypothetical protein [Verrucomicrobium sp. BvORR106]|uniref:hypothetical protein n=1 Tax=Verrucomicrobium sp. BvORR106 TaxID=1403819 RepID=UPI00056F562A|nr:hypothetical protein [Verrucomicrobium sp. BvORR106]
MSERSKSTLFLEYEGKLDHAADAVRRDPENRKSVENLLGLLEYYVGRAIPGDFELEMEVYGEARYWLAEDRCRDQVWAWMLKMAREAKGEQQGRMCVKIFEYLTLPNVGVEWMTLVFDTWCDNRLKWILPEIYRHKPEQLCWDMLAVSNAVEARNGK